MPHVIGTAGHVDHGKSALIQALTGTDPDRLAEEKARGLTIDLGFAWTTLPSGREVGFVDVPGHERFVHNMLAGVGGVDCALFVVDASEGWRPQSVEHLAILDLLGIPAGVVALTKVDLVDAATLERVAAEVPGRLQGTTLAGAALVPTAAPSGLGVDDLAAALDAEPAARSFFDQLDSANRYAVLWRVHTAASAQTRAKRIATLVQMLAEGRRIH